VTDTIMAVPTEVSEYQHWLRIARATSFGSLLFSVIAVTSVAFLEFRENGTVNLALVLWSVPLWLPYLWMFLQMKSKSAKRQKKGLALAIAYGAWALLIAAPSALTSSGLVLQASFAAFALLQLSLVVSPIKTYRAMEKERGDVGILVSRVLIASVCIGILCLAAIYIPNSYRARVAANESSSISATRTICVAQSSYAEKHPQKGFAASLSELGPPPGADLMDQDLAGGRKHGYSFQMIAAPPDASGRIRQYVVLARPLTFGQRGRRSFFADASGVIRSTAEDRAPTAQDPPLD